VSAVELLKEQIKKEQKKHCENKQYDDGYHLALKSILFEIDECFTIFRKG